MQISSQTNPMYIYQQSTDGTAQNAQATLEKAEQVTRSNLPPESPKGDSVHFSSDAKLLAEANRVAMQEGTADPARTEKVAQLRAQVQSGTYQMDDRAIAQGLAREESALFVV